MEHFIDDTHLLHTFLYYNIHYGLNCLKSQSDKITGLA